MGSRSFIEQLADIVILQGATDSDVVETSQAFGAALGIAGQADIDAANTYTYQVRNKDSEDWSTLQSPVATDLVAPKASKAVTLSELIAFKQFRIHSSGAVADDCTWKLTSHYTA